MDIFNTPYLYAKRFVAKTMLNTDIFVFCRYDPERDDKYQNYIVSFPDLVAAVNQATPGVNSVTGYNVNNANPANPVILPVQVDGVTITGTGVIGDPFVAVSTAPSIPVGNAIFVDAATGNDGTGVPGRFDLMFQTYAAAKLAAGGGDVIIMYPGTYAVSQMQFDDGIVYAHPGVILTGSQIVGDSGLTPGATFKLSGHAILQASGLYAGYFNSSGNVEIECDKILGLGVVATIRYAKVADSVKIKCNYIISSTSTTLWLESSNANARLVMDVLHYDNTTASPFEMPIYMGSNFAGNADLNFQLATSSPNRGSIGGNFFTNGGSSTCNFNMKIQELIDPPGVGNTILGQGGAGIFNIDIQKYTGPALAFSGFSVGGATYNINVQNGILTDAIAIVSNADKYSLSGYYESSVATAQAIVQANNTSKVKLTNFQSVSTTAPGVSVSGTGLLIVNEATVVTDGILDGFTAAAPSNIVVNGRAVTNGPITNITNLVTGTLLLSDPNIAL